MTYSSTKQTQNSNRIVKELNAKVLTATFKSKEGKQLADLYTSLNSGNEIVEHKSCAPINSTFIGTIKITFD
jgi:hypothetical protein